jgi:hypothetical protein
MALQRGKGFIPGFPAMDVRAIGEVEAGPELHVNWMGWNDFAAAREEKPGRAA